MNRREFSSMLPQLHNGGKFSGNILPASWNRVTLFALLLLLCFFGWTYAKPQPYYYGEGLNQRITCYTCANVSNNEDCNRFAIDRPCSAGKQFCMTLHVMEALDEERSILVSKRCASLEDCLGGPTGCITAYEHTKCISCCDYSYCNDYVPINETDAIFQRSVSSGSEMLHNNFNTTWRLIAVIFTNIMLVIFNGSSMCDLITQ